MTEDGSSVAPRSGVYPILVNDRVFGAMVEAIAKLSLKRGTFVTLRDVMVQCMEGSPSAHPLVLSTMKDLAPLEGHIRIYLRLGQRQIGRVEPMKAELAKHLQREVKTRDLVCFCCLQIAHELG
ncbi:hypothetical protein [Croceibacterium mercuriale]|uniref:hypothetical protein n=1 Tax=Croceibacterium mercuriale TaxID=1572751 RepID=UPI001269EA79|nr:hypothetical protein [Croceibacterium mercuriale]